MTANTANNSSIYSSADGETKRGFPKKSSLFIWLFVGFFFIMMERKKKRYGIGKKYQISDLQLPVSVSHNAHFESLALMLDVIFYPSTWTHLNSSAFVFWCIVSLGVTLLILSQVPDLHRINWQRGWDTISCSFSFVLNRNHSEMLTFPFQRSTLSASVRKQNKSTFNDAPFTR